MDECVAVAVAEAVAVAVTEAVAETDQSIHDPERALEYREGCTADEKNANGCREAMVGRTIVVFLQ